MKKFKTRVSDSWSLCTIHDVSIWNYWTIKHEINRRWYTHMHQKVIIDSIIIFIENEIVIRTYEAWNTGWRWTRWGPAWLVACWFLLDVGDPYSQRRDRRPARGTMNNGLTDRGTTSQPTDRARHRPLHRSRASECSSRPANRSTLSSHQIQKSVQKLADQNLQIT